MVYDKIMASYIKVYSFIILSYKGNNAAKIITVVHKATIIIGSYYVY